MSTITAKELRDNLDRIVRRARAGETINVTYRGKMAFLITPEHSKTSDPEPGSRAAVQRFLSRVNQRRRSTGSPIFNPDKSIKQLYHEMLDNDPKYRPTHRS